MARQQPGQAPQVRRAAEAAFWLRFGRIAESRNQVRIDVRICPARPIEVPEQPASITPADGFADHMGDLQPASYNRHRAKPRRRGAPTAASMVYLWTALGPEINQVYVYLAPSGANFIGCKTGISWHKAVRFPQRIVIKHRECRCLALSAAGCAGRRGWPGRGALTSRVADHLHLMKDSFF